MNRNLRSKSINCVHCGTPQPWASENASRVICPDCVISPDPRRHRFPRDEQVELNLPEAAA
jgi:hypothetical protein